MSGRQMNPTLLEIVTCKNGHSSTIRPTTFAWPEEDQKWIPKDSQPLAVACPVCKHVDIHETQPQQTIASLEGLSPYQPDAALHVFVRPIRCDTPNCYTPLHVLAVRSRNITAEALETEFEEWYWEGLKCPDGHSIPDRSRVSS